MKDNKDIVKKITDYIATNYSDRVDMTRLPMQGGLISYLGIDSMHSLEILIDMESIFGIEITDELLSIKLVDNVEYLTETISRILCKTG
ncbi:MAG: hypothetical protein C5B47_02420 [Verrucomicrobia bacterium]|nr:MAG: hypothetical protein C5B47_02420 [Verrucomicrobiota bacterium]